MHTHDTPHHTPPERATPRAIFFDPDSGAGTAGSRKRSGYSSHGRAALATALDEGLMPDEVARILGGRRIVEAFPIWQGESSAAYAARTVAEMFVAYLR